MSWQTELWLQKELLQKAAGKVKLPNVNIPNVPDNLWLKGRQFLKGPNAAKLAERSANAMLTNQRLKSLRSLKGGLASLAIDLALEKPMQQATAWGGKHLARGLVEGLGSKKEKQQFRKDFPSLYGKSGPDLPVQGEGAIPYLLARKNYEKSASLSQEVKEVNESSQVKELPTPDKKRINVQPTDDSSRIEQLSSMPKRDWSVNYLSKSGIIQVPNNLLKNEATQLKKDANVSAAVDEKSKQKEQQIIREATQKAVKLSPREEFALGQARGSIAQNKARIKELQIAGAEGSPASQGIISQEERNQQARIDREQGNKSTTTPDQKPKTAETKAQKTAMKAKGLQMLASALGDQSVKTHSIQNWFIDEETHPGQLGSWA